MKYFNDFVSNTCAGSSNQYFFEMEKGEILTGRAFYKIFAGGTYKYSLLFTNTVDGEFRDALANSPCGEWEICSARLGKCSSIPASKLLKDITMEELAPYDFKQITFDGNATKKVSPDEFFTSDPTEMSFEKDEYLCLELTYRGTKLPCHEEVLIPVYVKKDGAWEYSKKMPLPSMVGCDRPVKGRVGYLGDSITQGIGPLENSYLHWNALLSEKIGEEYSFWNLGIGCGDTSNLSIDGAWLRKAKNNDIVFVCLGVNDINRGHSAETIKKDLDTVIDKLIEAGARIIIQTIPPFDYVGERVDIFNEVNSYIRNELSKKAEMVFDATAVLCLSAEEEHMTKYGDHPNAEGCRIWAEKLYSALEENKIFK